MQNAERLSITLPAEMLRLIRAKIAEADADPRPSLSEADVDKHFAARRKKPISEAILRDEK